MTRARKPAHLAPDADPANADSPPHHDKPRSGVARGHSRHRFTDPTPVAGRSGPVVSVMIADWEIQCCAPPPTVGEIGRWRLSFGSAAQCRDPALDHEREWLWAPWPGPGSRSCCLRAGPIKVYWAVTDEPLAGQRIRLRGQVFGTKHGGTDWDEFPTTTGLVTRVRVVTSDFAWDAHTKDHRMVPGTTTFVDVDRSPNRFPSSLIPDESACWRRTHRVLIDLIHQQ